MSDKEEIEVIVVDDQDQDENLIDKAKNGLSSVGDNEVISKTIEGVSEFTQSALHKGSEFFKSNKVVQDTLDAVKTTTNKTITYVKDNEVIQNTYQTSKSATLKGAQVVKEGIDDFVSKPEVSATIEKVRNVSADVLESTGKTLATWIRPKDKKEEGE